MEIDLIVVPYHLGHARVGPGLGPERLLAAGAEQALLVAEHPSTVTPVEIAEEQSNEIGSLMAVNRQVARRVRQTVAGGSLPLVLSGNCNASIGTVGGLETSPLGIVWFDAHGDYETPETTPSGLFDGMILSVLTGDCWTTLRTGVSSAPPIAKQRILNVGARTIEGGERERIEASSLVVLDPERFRQGGGSSFRQALATLSQQVDGIYLHVDMDVLDPSEGAANNWAAPGGLSLAELEAAIVLVGEMLPIQAAGVASYDPTIDSDGRVARAGVRVIAAISRAVDAPRPIAAGSR